MSSVGADVKPRAVDKRKEQKRDKFDRVAPDQVGEEALSNRMDMLAPIRGEKGSNRFQGNDDGDLKRGGMQVFIKDHGEKAKKAPKGNAENPRNDVGCGCQIFPHHT